MKLLVERDIEVPMRDGVILRADLYRPDVSGPLPALLQRTIYNKGAIEPPPIVARSAAAQLDPIRAASNGYAVVIQDERGCYASDGDLRLFLDCANDGYDTVEWIADQPWSNGRVGMYGVSYVAATQWLTASAAPPHLVCMCPGLTGSNYFANWCYRQGVLELAFCKSWLLMYLAPAVAHRLSEPAAGAARAQLEAAAERFDAVLARLPVSDFPEIDDLIDSFAEWAGHERYDQWWEAIDIERKYEQITIPVQHVAGWYDVFLDGVLQNFQGMRQRGGSPEARASQRLMVGPWMHDNGPFSTRVGEIEFGAAAGVDWDTFQLRWFDHWLRGIDDGLAAEPPVRLFVMGANSWRDEHEWPLARTSWTNLYLDSDGCANGLRGCGRLTWEPPVAEGSSDSYLYDPSDPTPTRGGTLCCWPPDLAAGAFDQRLVEERRDVLVYSTPELREPVEVTGPVRAVIYASSTACDTDFTAKLVDVHPDGFAQNLCEGIVRARYRDGTGSPALLEPGEVVRYEIDMWATSNLFLAGHRIRLELASACFPKYDRNFNVQTAPLHASEGTVARQTVFHGPGRHSHLVLPVIPKMM